MTRVFVTILLLEVFVVGLLLGRALFAPSCDDLIRYEDDTSVCITRNED